MSRYKVLLYLLVPSCVAALILPVFTFTSLYPAIDNLLVSNAEHQARMVAGHLATYITVPSGDSLRPGDITPDLRDEIAKLSESFALEKVKVFSDEGEVLFSTSQDEIGSRNDSEYFHTVVLRGKNFSKMVSKDSRTLEGRAANKDLIETYVPIRARDGVAGAFEIYYDITSLKGLLADLVHRASILIYGVSLVLLAALLASLGKLSGSMAAREQAELALARQRDETEKLVAHRTEDIARANQQMKNDFQRVQAAEQGLLASEEKFRLLVEQASDAIFVADAETGIISYVNRKGQELIGRQAVDIIGLHLLALHPDDEGALYRKIVARHYKSPPAGRTLTVVHASGRLVPVEISAAILGSNGRKIVHCLFRDITRRLRIDEELQKADRHKVATQLAGGIAHDFNNQLTAILGNVSLAQIEASDDERMMKRLHATEDAINRARALTQQLTAFARGGEPERRTVALEKIIEEEAQSVVQGSKVSLECAIAPDLWPAFADPGQVGQVIDSLVTHAANVMREGGTCRVTADNAEVAEENLMLLAPGRYIRIAVQDEGSIIPEDRLSRIFDPFFSSKQKGGGLGLSTAYSIVKNHEGQIQVTSQVGKKTTFVVYLPASSEQGSVAAPEGIIASIEGSGRILVMDDEDIVREAISSLLEFLGYEVATAVDGVAALKVYSDARAEGRPFQVVIMDLTVPGGMGGKDAVRKLKEMDPAARVIVSSGYYSDPVMANYSEYGFDGVAPKPYKLEDLGRVVKEVLTRKPA
ncbi:MAG TPA: hypothetical protein DDY20_08715 [Desulfobulbaceae bacterium]|nr:hypothetical protein [Desulfobulbaceae bacterium]